MSRFHSKKAALMGINTIWFFFKVLLILAFQVLVLNNIQLLGYLNPYFYVWLVLYAPSNQKQTTLLVTSFLLGLMVDVFENSGGLHASATLTLAFVRPVLMRLISTKGEMEVEKLNLIDLGFYKFATFTIIGLLVHHGVLFLLESFRFTELFAILLRTVFSVAFSFVLLLFFQMLFGKRSN